MSLKIRRSRGGWQVWRHGSVQAIPPVGGKPPKPIKLKPIKLKGGMTRGEAKNAIFVARHIDDMVRQAIFGYHSTFYYQYNQHPDVSVDDNYGTITDTVSDVLSGCVGVPEIQPEDF
ncbi:hypothetical protein vBAbaMD22_01 [Acinetobacter phage vB_AbaM_D22]|nr:hypothetical protein vBAbaMD22_01 [Acinetobacter phage vB_AbaM_D22]